MPVDLDYAEVCTKGCLILSQPVCPSPSGRSDRVTPHFDSVAFPQLYGPGERSQRANKEQALERIPGKIRCDSLLGRGNPPHDC